MFPSIQSYTDAVPPVALKVGHIRCTGKLFCSNGRDALIGIATAVKPGDLITVIIDGPRTSRECTGVAHSIVQGQHYAKCGVSFREFVPELFRANDMPGCVRRVRFACCSTGVLKQSLDRLKMPATAVDYSRRGLSLETYRPFREGEGVQFEFHDRRTETRIIELIVRWSKFNGRIHCLGCELPLGSKGEYPMAEFDVEAALTTIP